MTEKIRLFNNLYKLNDMYSIKIKNNRTFKINLFGCNNKIFKNKFYILNSIIFYLFVNRHVSYNKLTKENVNDPIDIQGLSEGKNYE